MREVLGASPCSALFSRLHDVWVLESSPPLPEHHCTHTIPCHVLPPRPALRGSDGFTSKNLSKVVDEIFSSLVEGKGMPRALWVPGSMGWCLSHSRDWSDLPAIPTTSPSYSPNPRHLGSPRCDLECRPWPGLPTQKITGVSLELLFSNCVLWEK